MSDIWKCWSKIKELYKEISKFEYNKSFLIMKSLFNSCKKIDTHFYPGQGQRLYSLNLAVLAHSGNLKKWREFSGTMVISQKLDFYMCIIFKYISYNQK